MASSLDMSLDDLIKKNKKPKPPSSNSPHGGFSSGIYGGGGGGGGTGPTRRLPDRSMNRINPYAPFDKAPDLVWQHDMYLNQFGTGVATRVAGSANTTTNSSIEISTKIHVSNLDFGVLNEDIKELFGEVGELKSYSINYDRSGRSKGTAEVVFAKMADAIAAVKRYNGVQLDGKAMKIEIISTHDNDINTPLIPTLNSNNRLTTPNNNVNINNIQGHLPILPTPLIGTNNNNNNIQSTLLASPIIRANNTMHTPLLPNPFPFHGGFQNFNSPAASRRSNDRDRAGKGTGGRNDRDRENRIKKKANVSASDLDAELDKYMQSKTK